MLAKIEESYLTILRVAVVAVAGLALIIAAAALAAGVVYFASGILSSATGSVEGGSLGQYIAERRIPADIPDSGSGADAPDRQAAAAYIPAIDAAADVFARYAARHKLGPARKSDYILAINALWLDVSPDRQSQYEASLSRLANQLRSSKGRPLSLDRLSELLSWHHTRFQQAVSEQEQAADAAKTEAWLWLVRAGQAFLMFVVIAFYFLLLRVERHLRVVRVHRESPQPQTVAAAEQE